MVYDQGGDAVLWPEGPLGGAVGSQCSVQVRGWNLAAGTIDGYCAGEPWNTLAVREGAGWCPAWSAAQAPGSAPCPCGAAARYADCCGRYLDHWDTQPAPDAEHIIVPLPPTYS